MVVAGSPGVARIGALALCVSWLAPVLVTLTSQLLLSQSADVDSAVQADHADELRAYWLTLWIGAVVWSMAIVPVLLLTTWRPPARPEAALMLRVLVVVRALAAWASLGVLYNNDLQIWQAATALALPEIFFVMALLRYLADLFAEDNASLARSTRQFAWLYVAYRVVLLGIWAFPADLVPFLTLAHRSTAPIMEAVVAFLLLKAAGRFATKG